MLGEPKSRRRRTFDAGRRAEQLAVLWLMLKGYRVLTRRFSVHGGELDIVVLRRHIVAVVEVKARPTLEAAQIAVTPVKLRRIERAAAVWLSRHPWAAQMTLRGDLLLIAPRRFPRHVAGALPLRI